jgi:hypothetical protein
MVEWIVTSSPEANDGSSLALQRAADTLFSDEKKVHE